MATREASIKVTLAGGSFVSGIQAITSKVKVAGIRMGSALGGPISAGLNSAKKSLSDMGTELKRNIGSAVKLGGAMATGFIIKDAMKLNSLYRAISFTTSKLPGQAMEWQSVQEMISASAMKTGRSSEELANSFHDILKNTGDLEFAKSAIESIGMAATGSYENVEDITTAAELMRKKFDISGADIQSGLAAFINLTGSGGKSIEDLTSRFGALAGHAKDAGLTGVGGVKQLLGTMISLNETIADADPGLKMMFQILKDGSSQFTRIQKAGRIKFAPDTSAFEKLKKILSSTKGRATAEMVFTADSRQVFDALAKPFDIAFKEAQEKGMSRADSLNAGLAAFDSNIAKSSTTTMQWNDIQQRAVQNMKDDPSVALRKAMERIRDAFAQPKMIKSIEKLADKLPILADKLADLVDWAVENPWKAGAAGAGLKVGTGFLGGALGSGFSSVAKGLFGLGGGAAAAGAGGAAAGAAGAGAAGAGAGAAASKLGLVWRGLLAAKGGLASVGSALAGKLSSAGLMSSVAGAGAGATAGAIGAGAAVGGAIGYTIHKTVTDPLMKADFGRVETLDEILSEIQRQSVTGGAAFDPKAALSVLEERMKGLKGGPSAWTGMVSEFASKFSDVVPITEQYQRQMEAIIEAEIKLRKSMSEQATNPISGIDKFAQSVANATTYLDKFKTGPNWGNKNNLPVTPGSAPAGAHE